MTSAADSILTINAGSSSVRLDLFARRGSGLARTWSRHLDAAESRAPLPVLDEFIDTAGVLPGIIAHRIVHGGETLILPHRVDAEIERVIERMTELAPLHNGPALEWIRLCRRRFPDITQVAVCDTAFYANLPPVARTYPIDAVVAQRHGLRRYGFHGLAHDAMWQRWRELAPQVDGGGRVLSLHLGAGCSITATERGRAVDTSMGFSPLEGLMMATRGGDLDPGLLLYLQRAESMAPEAMEAWLNHQCGLLGVSGLSADMRELLASNAPAAELAVELFCYRARKHVGAFLAALGGADAVLIGGGIGEHQPTVRARILSGMQWAGINLDGVANFAAAQGDTCISTPDSPVQIWIIAVDEAARIAQYAAQTLTDPQ
jgi:acetate kinase